MCCRKTVWHFSTNEFTILPPKSGYDTRNHYRTVQQNSCVITTSIETLDGIRKGDINAMSAVMTGKVKIKGDMGLAMKLPSLIS